MSSCKVCYPCYLTFYLQAVSQQVYISLVPAMFFEERFSDTCLVSKPLWVRHCTGPSTGMSRSLPCYVAIPSCHAWWALPIYMHYLCPTFSQVFLRFITNCCLAINLICLQKWETCKDFVFRLLPWLDLSFSKCQEQSHLSMHAVNIPHTWSAEYFVSKLFSQRLKPSTLKCAGDFAVWVLEACWLHLEQRPANIHQLRTVLQLYCNGLKWGSGLQWAAH